MTSTDSSARSLIDPRSLPARVGAGVGVLLALLLTGGRAEAQLTSTATVSASRLWVSTSPWYPSEPASEQRETSWSMQNLQTTVQLTLEVKVSPTPSNNVTLPLYHCRYPSPITLKSTREYSVIGEFTYNTKITAYHSQLISFRADFLANGADCLGTGATGSLLGYVVDPKNAVAYLKANGGGLDPILSCARYTTKTSGTYGKDDYQLSGATCENTVFAGFTTGVRQAQTASGRKPERFAFSAQEVRLARVAPGSVQLLSVFPLGFTLQSSNQPASWPIAGAGAGASFANTAAISFFGARETTACQLDSNRDPALASAQLGGKLAPAGACALAGSIGALARFETARAPSNETIHVRSATYGANCRGKVGGASTFQLNDGNSTMFLARSCDGKQRSCDYVIDYKAIGDPAPGCAKDYAAEWTCGDQTNVQRARVEPEAGFRKTISLTCAGPASPPPPAPAPRPTIQVVAGTYGASCGQPSGNKTSFLAQECNGKGTCNYVVNYHTIGDPAYGCAKDYVAEWRCGSETQLRRASAPPEAGFGKTVTLTCN